MKINNRHTFKSVNVQISGAINRSREQSGTLSVSASKRSEDRVELSDDAADFQQIKAVIATIPDVREDLVSALKSAVENGTYHVPAEQVAEQMIKESLLNASILN
jgi:flagellar biosynthesis anti-sigma factor FlgM